MSVVLLERAAEALGELRDEVVFLGGASVSLWITDPAAPAPRPTKDVDVVVEVASHPDLQRFEARLRDHRFREARESGIICRWEHADDEELLLDVMPTDPALLGFENQWQAAGVPSAEEHELPSGRRIRAVAPPYLVATKVEAFAGRGNGDHMVSRDLEDIVLLMDGRATIVEEVAAAPSELRRYLAAELGGLLDEPRFVDAVYMFLRPDPASQARAESVVLPRLRAAAGR